jgi:hypothetical protein
MSIMMSITLSSLCIYIFTYMTPHAVYFIPLLLFSLQEIGISLPFCKTIKGKDNTDTYY